MQIPSRQLARLAPMILLLLAGLAKAGAQTTEPRRFQSLLNLDAPAVLGRGELWGRLDVRAFGGDEDVVYVGLALHYGAGNGWEGILRGAFADRQTIAPPGAGVRHGGSDVELALKYQPAKTPNIAGLIGVSIPSTPAQSDSFLTLGGTASADLGDRATVILNPRALFIDSNTIIGIGLGASVRVAQRLILVGDYTPIVSGDNTRDTATGGRKRRDVYGVAARLGPASGSFNIDLGYANGLGPTTGFGLTPGLGGSGAFYFSITARR